MVPSYLEDTVRSRAPARAAAVLAKVKQAKAKPRQTLRTLCYDAGLSCGATCLTCFEPILSWVSKRWEDPPEDLRLPMTAPWPYLMLTALIPVASPCRLPSSSHPLVHVAGSPSAFSCRWAFRPSHPHMPSQYTLTPWCVN